MRDLVYDYDWLANQTEWTDDQGVFYERSSGLLSSGNDDPGFSALSPANRPSALYLSTNIREAPATRQVGVDHGGYATLDYGEDGNVLRMTVCSQCQDRSRQLVCADPRTASLATRRATLENNCRCQAEQHYRYDWDELNRLSEARRYDRQNAAGAWRLMVQQRYRYDASNVRMVKETINAGDPANGQSAFAATTLHPYPGDYERRGLELDFAGRTYHASTALGTETQYLVGGARLVWANNDPLDPAGSLTREQRLTLPLSDLVQSTAAVVDLQSGDLLEHTTFYPNGARETHRTTDDVSLQLEPIGFTGKEADEEVGLVYFGERYLIPRLGRWASVDPLSVHAMGGGEAMNGYHYVRGNLLQTRDPIGLDPAWKIKESSDGGLTATANVELAVYDGAGDSASRAAAATLQEQADEWNSREYTTTAGELGIEGYEADTIIRVRFRIVVRAVTSEEAAYITGLGGGSPMTGGDMHSDSDLAAAVAALSDRARDSSADRGLNFALVGTGMNGGERAFTQSGNVIGVPRSALASDRRGGSYTGTHEIGHLLGLGDRYPETGSYPANVPTGATNPYRGMGNIMSGGNRCPGRSCIRRAMRLQDEQVLHLAYQALSGARNPGARMGGHFDSNSDKFGTRFANGSQTTVVTSGATSLVGRILREMTYVPALYPHPVRPEP